MKLIDLKSGLDYEKIKYAATIINEGGLVLFPTETVYGIGADGLNEKAVKKIFESKGRASDNPLILHISSMDMVNSIATDITNLEYKLMDAFWPGPFTIILKKKNNVPYAVTGGLKTVAVRMPANKIANALIKHANTPIAAPSANISGKPSGTCLEDIYEELEEKMDCIIDGGKCDFGIESTVVKVEDGTVRILRPGKITKEQIQTVVDSVVLDEHIFHVVKSDSKVLSPGMKYKHYAPNAKCILIYSRNEDKMINQIIEETNDFTNNNKKIAIICSDEHKERYNCENILTYGSKHDLDEIASNIFTVLRKVDLINADVVYIEGLEKTGIGIAIMNRLIRACSHEYLEVK